MNERLTDWWDDLGELERANWVIAASFAASALIGIILRVVAEVSR